jgi:opacity protein-like surface antigen
MARRFGALATLLTLVAFASPALAEGFYVGAGIGNTFFSSKFSVGDVSDQVQDIDENSTAWKIFGGFSGHKFLGLEGGYRDFGEIESDFGSETLKSKVKGWDVEALGRIQIAIVDVFAKAGVMFWDSETTFGDETADDSGTNFLWGLGAGVHLGPIGVRLEWETLEQKDVDNLSAVSLGATLGF